MAEIFDINKFRQKKLEKKANEEKEGHEKPEETQEKNSDNLSFDIVQDVMSTMFLSDKIDKIMKATEGATPSAINEGEKKVQEYDKRQLLIMIKDSCESDWNRHPGLYKVATKKLIEQLGKVFRDE